MLVTNLFSFCFKLPHQYLLHNKGLDSEWFSFTKSRMLSFIRLWRGQSARGNLTRERDFFPCSCYLCFSFLALVAWSISSAHGWGRLVIDCLSHVPKIQRLSVILQPQFSPGNYFAMALLKWMSCISGLMPSVPWLPLYMRPPFLACLYLRELFLEVLLTWILCIPGFVPTAAS